MESWADGAEAASDIAAGTTAYLSNPPAARVWEGLAEHVKAKKAERMLQKLRGQERGRLEVGVWEGEGALRLVVKLPKVRCSCNLIVPTDPYSYTDAEF